MEYDEIRKLANLLSINADAVRINIAHNTGEEASAWLLRRVHQMSEDLERLRCCAVYMARAEGYTWEEVGNALHCTRQAAWERYH